MSEKKKIDIWSELNEYFNEEPDCQAGTVEKEKIIAAEKVLGVQFTENYKVFITAYGGATIGAYSVYGLAYQNYMDGSIWSVVHNTEFYKIKQKWPGIDDWYIISDDGRGNPIGINPKGEVWLSDHDSNFEQVKLADSFEEFIHKLLTDTLYD